MRITLSLQELLFAIFGLIFAVFFSTAAAISACVDHADVSVVASWLLGAFTSAAMMFVSIADPR